MNNFKHVFWISLILFCASCAYDKYEEEVIEDPIEDPCADPVSFANDVKVIINTSCAVSGCHGNVQSPLLTTDEAILSNATQIQFQVTSGQMPPARSAALEADEIALIDCWVEQGAQDN